MSIFVKKTYQEVFEGILTFTDDVESGKLPSTSQVWYVDVPQHSIAAINTRLFKTQTMHEYINKTTHDDTVTFSASAPDGTIFRFVNIELLAIMKDKDIGRSILLTGCDREDIVYIYVVSSIGSLQYLDMNNVIKNIFDTNKLTEGYVGVATYYMYPLISSLISKGDMLLKSRLVRDKNKVMRVLTEQKTIAPGSLVFQVHDPLKHDQLKTPELLSETSKVNEYLKELVKM